MAFIADLDVKGLGVTAPDSVVEHEVADYTGLRNAVGEITPTVFVLIAGYILFWSDPPRVI